MITWNQPDSSTYAQVIDLVAAMVRDRNVQALARERGLHILDVTWEDTGRYKGSAAGPNISDMTIHSKQQPPGWWNDFWRRYRRDTGQSPEEALAMLRRVRPGWQPANQDELRQALGAK